MEGSLPPRTNQLLARFPPDVYEALRPRLQLCQLPAGKVIFEDRAECGHLYFPVSGIIARVLVNVDDEATELSLCGSEGVVGISLLLGDGAIASALVLIDACAYRCPRDTLAGAMAVAAFRNVILRYAHFVVGEIAQCALCNKHHELDSQFARWLLVCADRVGQAELRVTHAMVSRMLGVRREGVTEAAGRLHAAGAISVSRGVIRVLDRGRLLQRACSCYLALESESRRLLYETPAEPSRVFQT